MSQLQGQNIIYLYYVCTSPRLFFEKKLSLNAMNFCPAYNSVFYQVRSYTQKKVIVIEPEDMNLSGDNSDRRYINRYRNRYFGLRHLFSNSVLTDTTKKRHLQLGHPHLGILLTKFQRKRWFIGAFLFLSSLN